jgi:hypothetical protein
MSETKNWRLGKKSKCFPSKSRKNKGNIAALWQKKVSEIFIYFVRIN